MPHLSETLESLRTQSFSDFDLLIIDDGSTDNSLEFLTDFVSRQNSSRIRLLSRRNKGLTGTLNEMLELLQSGWMVRQDADDIALPDRLRRIADYIEQYPEAGMIYSYAAHFQAGALKGQLLTTPTDSTGLRSFLEQGYLPSICHPAIALRVEAALALGGYRFDLHVEDYDLYWRMGLRFDARLIPETLLGYRMTSSSISDQNSQVQATNLLYVQYLLLSRLWQKKELLYDEVLPVLSGMVDRGHLKFRRFMRSAMVHYGARQHLLFISYVGRAFWSSPGSFLRRFFLNNSQVARVGISPKLFQQQEVLLWPNSREN